MAIPFNLPTQQDTEDNYDVLDQLLEQLYEVMLEILRQRRLRDQLYEIMLEILRQRRRLRDSRSAVSTTLMSHSKCYLPTSDFTFLNCL